MLRRCHHFPSGQVAAGIRALIESSALGRCPHPQAPHHPIGSACSRCLHVWHASIRFWNVASSTGPDTSCDTSAFTYWPTRFTARMARA